MQTDEKKMMTYQETMDYIDSLQSGGIVPGLDNIRACLLYTSRCV